VPVGCPRCSGFVLTVPVAPPHAVTFYPAIALLPVTLLFYPVVVALRLRVTRCVCATCHTLRLHVAFYLRLRSLTLLRFNTVYVALLRLRLWLRWLFSSGCTLRLPRVAVRTFVISRLRLLRICVVTGCGCYALRYTLRYVVVDVATLICTVARFIPIVFTRPCYPRLYGYLRCPLRLLPHYVGIRSTVTFLWLLVVRSLRLLLTHLLPSLLLPHVPRYIAFVRYTHTDLFGCLV